MKLLIRILFNAWSFLLSLLPMKVQLFIGKFLGWIWYDVIRLRRQIVLDNLDIAFPDLDPEEKVRIGRRSLENTATTFIEFLRIFRVSAKDKKLFHIEGLEHLHRALEQKRGALLLTQHIANGDWATVGLALHDVNIHVISKSFKLKALNEVWFELRAKIGTTLIKDRNTSYAILKALKKNKPVVFVLDQFMGPPIGIRTKFFGKETGTAMGLAIIARRSGAPVLPVYTLRNADGTTLIHFDPEIPFIESPDQENTVQDMTQVYCDKVEQYVRKFPEQWMWVHRRWKVFKY